MMLEFFTNVSHGNKILVLIMINVFLVAIGMIMDDTCATMLCTPLLMPLAISFDISPYQMAAILGVNLGMGNVTPPTAPFLYMASQMANVNSAKVIKYVLILILCAYVPTLILTSYIPELATFLPKLILGDKFI
jgi:C4-dicarboxylate transporter DctM subunit